jgi:hemerythrin-like metal-binding protein
MAESLCAATTVTFTESALSGTNGLDAIALGDRMARKIPDSLLTGFVLIDRQHEAIYAQFDELMEQLQEGANAKQVLKTIAYVERHVLTNFDFEETAMAAFDYPHRVEHMAAHLILRENVKDIRREVEQGNITPTLIDKCREMLYDALFRHIAEHDLKMAPFLKENNPDDEGWSL